jgi:hypothetical protein
MDSYRLAFEPQGSGASTDLKKRHIEVGAWFAGEPVYGAIESADYPPASYPVFWPFIGWGMSLEQAKIAWALSSLAALAWLTLTVVRSSGGTPLEQWFLAAAVTSTYAVSANLRIGQVGIHLMAVILAAARLLARTPRTPLHDGLAAALMLLAVVKPTFGAPFVWLAVVLGGINAAAGIGLGYLALTVFGASFQDASLPELIRGWLDQSSLVEFDTAHANVHSWLGRAGLDDWLLPASLIMLALAGIWTFLCRRASPWILLGVLAIVARIWSYHRWYDDILMIPPLLALFHVARDESDRSPVGHVAAALMLGIALLGAAPGSLLSYPPPWGDAFKLVKTTVWMTSLAFLLWRAGLPTAVGVRSEQPLPAPR